ncbi:MAG: DNA translocase FtsK [Actinomycetota bacterium]|nr:DNA translocase FtsK [Actinomycetota bacterium]
MPTKTSPPRRKRRTPTRKAATKRRPAARRKPARTPVITVLSPWARDAIGIGLVVMGLLSMLSVWLHAAGLGGHAISSVLHALFGVAAVVFPVVGVYWGILLLRDTARDQRVRMFIGFAAATVGALGIVSLVAENPAPDGGYVAIAKAGGFLGALLADPLSRVLSSVGAAIVCVGLLFLGSLIFSGTPLAAVRERLREYRDERDERDPVRATAREGSRGRGWPRRRGGALREAFGLDEVVLVPDAEDLYPEPIEELIDPETGDDDAPILKQPRPRTVATASGPYHLPPADLLRAAPPSTADGRHQDEVMAALERTLRDFGVDAHVTGSHRGPTVTMYEVEVAAGTKVNKVLNLSSDIAYALATPDVRIQAPIPGKSAIGIEVPNQHRDFVMLGDVLRSKAAKDSDHPLTVALGKDVHGRAQMVNLATMPHVLIAGATGAGKSSLVNCFITSLLMRTTPDDVRLVLVDPKRVELIHFAEVPHLLSPVIVHPKRAAEALQWLVREMELRYEILSAVGVRDIDGYEEGLRGGTLRLPVGHEHEYVHMPFIVVVIDELSDLMMVAPREVEDAICRIAQMARAVGIHLVVATQRPSVDVVTGLIKANIPSRIALMTSSQADSRVVLDMNGAEKLVGHGDMLFAPANASKPTRLQGAWVTEAEIHGVTSFIREQRTVVYESNVEGLGLPPGLAPGESGDHGLGDDDDLLEQAAQLVVRSQLGSTSMLQRKLKVGFARAGRIMDLMEEKGIVGPSQGSKARDVLVTPEDWEERETRAADTRS